MLTYYYYWVVTLHTLLTFCATPNYGFSLFLFSFALYHFSTRLYISQIMKNSFKFILNRKLLILVHIKKKTMRFHIEELSFSK